MFYRSYHWHTEVVKEERLTFTPHSRKFPVTSAGGRMHLVQEIYLHNNIIGEIGEGVGGEKVWRG